MLRSTTARAVAQFLRNFSSCPVVMAPKKGGAVKPAGKTKAKSSFAPQKQQTKVKKGGMTHLGFRDAVREMKFEKFAAPLEVETLQESSLNKLQGNVVRYMPGALTKLDMLNGFKNYQHHELFEKPVSLVSQNCTKLNQEFIGNLDKKSSKDNRVCFVGEKGCGKSTLLAQSIALASSKYEDVILLHLDKPENIGNGTSDYIYNESLGKYQQPMFTKRWIWNLKIANEAIFKKLKLSQDITFQSKRVDHHLKKDVNTVYDLLQSNHDFGKFAPTNAFRFLVSELIHHSQNVPIMVSLDNVNGLVDTTTTQYRSPSFKPLHISDFEMGDFFLKLISGEISFNKGGVLMANTSDFGEFLTTLQVSLGLKEYDPYAKSSTFDIKVANRLLNNGGVKPFKVENLTKDETRNLLTFYKDHGVLQVRDYPHKEVSKTLDTAQQNQHQFNSDDHFEKVINNHYTVSSGNPGYLLSASVLSY